MEHATGSPATLRALNIATGAANPSPSRSPTSAPLGPREDGATPPSNTSISHTPCSPPSPRQLEVSFLSTTGGKTLKHPPPFLVKTLYNMVSKSHILQYSCLEKWATATLERIFLGLDFATLFTRVYHLLYEPSSIFLDAEWPATRKEECVSPSAGTPTSIRCSCLTLAARATCRGCS